MTRAPRTPPAYRRLAQRLAAELKTGLWRRGDTLPPENELARGYGVSRRTVRSALALMQNDGLIDKGQGRNARYCARVIESQGRNLDDFPTAARQVGMTPATRVLGVAGRSSGLAESRALGLAVGTAVTEIERLRLLDGRPVVRQASVLPQWVADTLPVDRLMRDSLYDLIRRATGATLRIGSQHYSAVAASPGQAADLGLEPGASLLRLCRLVVDAEGRPVEYSDSLVRDGYFRFDD